MDKLVIFKDEINQLLARYGVKFGIYKNNEFHEQLFPFDPIPRVIEHEEFEELEKGLIQRVNALNQFLLDVYTDQKIVKDGVVPVDYIFTSPGFLAQCQGIVPPEHIFAHIAGIDLVKGKDETWYVLEDNLRVPSGASYPMIARSLCRRASPNTFRENSVEDNRNYGSMVRCFERLWMTSIQEGLMSFLLQADITQHFLNILILQKKPVLLLHFQVISK